MSSVSRLDIRRSVCKIMENNFNFASEADEFNWLKDEFDRVAASYDAMAASPHPQPGKLIIFFISPSDCNK